LVAELKPFLQAANRQLAENADRGSRSETEP
jgi:hypothetical protein